MFTIEDTEPASERLGGSAARYTEFSQSSDRENQKRETSGNGWVIRAYEQPI
jgi:hypothetical protein